MVFNSHSQAVSFLLQLSLFFVIAFLFFSTIHFASLILSSAFAYILFDAFALAHFQTYDLHILLVKFSSFLNPCLLLPLSGPCS